MDTTSSGSVAYATNEIQAALDDYFTATAGAAKTQEVLRRKRARKASRASRVSRGKDGALPEASVEVNVQSPVRLE